MRYGYLIALGLTLMAIGGILLGVSGVKINTIIKNYYSHILVTMRSPQTLFYEHDEYDNRIYR